MGYHLRRCSFCNRKRIFKRHDRNRPHPDDLTAEELTDHFNRKIAQTLGQTTVPKKGQGGTVASNSSQTNPGPGDQPQPSAVGVITVPDEGDDYRLCPRCGGTVYRRSRRRWYERFLNRPKMARCLRCDNRFPYPH
jgi:hypothetical protein